jgi:hypothetical protein
MGASQRWSYDETSGLIRNMQDPHFCLDNSIDYGDGAKIMLWSCNSDQRFQFDPATGKIALRNYPVQALDASASQAGANVQTWRFWGGSNQRWSMEP